MRRHLNAVWVTRLDLHRPYQQVGINGDDLAISFMPGKGGTGISINVSRKDARLLAKRINQCLDATVKS